MTTIDPEPLLAAPGRHGRVPRTGSWAARQAIHRFLDTVEGGELTVVDAGRTYRFGANDEDRHSKAWLRATVTVHDPRWYTAMALQGSSGLGEAYIRGWFDVDDLTALLRLMSRSVRRLDRTRLKVASLGRPLLAPVRWAGSRRHRRADAARDRAAVAAHYDLGNEFFELFLDETLTYSAGWFEEPEVSLEVASVAKLDRICRKLDLAPGQRVAEIGTGWGSFALHAASRYGVEVVTTTLSVEQHRTATERVAAAGLADRVEVRLGHYRDLRGSYDAVVSVEMIEAVDWREVPDFLEHCARLTRYDGAVALQAIVAAPSRQAIARSSTDFIATHVFPGSSIPSVSSILEGVAERTDLVPTDLADFGLHYAETLRRWRANLGSRRHDAVALGLDESFLRLWDFYLCYCEAGFEERQVSVAQIVLQRPGRARSLDHDRQPRSERNAAAASSRSTSRSG